MSEIYWCQHYSGGRPYEIDGDRILRWAEDDGQSFENVEDAIAFLNGIGDVTIWAIVERYEGGSYQDLNP